MRMGWLFLLLQKPLFLQKLPRHEFHIILAGFLHDELTSLDDIWVYIFLLAV